MPANTASALRLAFFWFGIQAIWGALLGISLQARCAQIAGSHAIILYGEIATSGAIVAACVQLLVGPWSDRRRAAGSRRLEFYVAGALLGAAALIWFYAADGAASLLCAYAAVQAGLNVAIGPYQAAIPDAVEPSRTGYASGWMAGFQSGGNAAGALLATAVGNPLLLAATLGALLLLGCAVTSTALRGWTLQSVSVVPMRLSRAFAILFASRVALFAGLYTLLGYLFFYVLDYVARDASKARVVDGIFVLGFTLAGAAGAAIAAKPSDRYDRRNVASVGGAVVVVALALFVAGRTPIVAVPAILLAGLGWGVFLAADWALACRIIPAHAAAGAMAVWNLGVIVPQIIAPLLTTVVLARFDMLGTSGPAAAFALAGLEMLLGIWLLRRLPAASLRE
jgi:MFS family permease